jgi:hypothetical protein
LSGARTPNSTFWLLHIVAGGENSFFVTCFVKGSITLAFWMCSFNVRFTVECVFYVVFSVENSKMTSKT